jgi:hypothetical protein
MTFDLRKMRIICREVPLGGDYLHEQNGITSIRPSARPFRQWLGH